MSEKRGQPACQLLRVGPLGDALWKARNAVRVAESSGPIYRSTRKELPELRKQLAAAQAAYDEETERLDKDRESSGPLPTTR